MSTRSIGLGAFALRSTLLALLGLALAGAPAAVASPGDYDADGTPNAQDCAPLDPAVHPGAADRPDLAFEDTNCDGIDGDATKAIFVAPGGRDADPGTLALPKKTLAAAIGAAKAQGKDVYLAGGTYPGSASLVSGVGLYGGYEVITGRRSDREVTQITGTPQGALADGAVGVVLQQLTLSGTAPAGTGTSAYGLRAINGSEVVLQRVISQAGAGSNGADGTTGTNGANGGDGQDGDPYVCCPGSPARGGDGGTGADDGGDGGDSQPGVDGGAGADGATGGGKDGTQGTGGAGGTSTARDGQLGTDGGTGATGTPGLAGSFATSLAAAAWVPRDGATAGGAGGDGGGGGGGGAGTGAPDCGPGLTNPTGDAGGGGGAGGAGGSGGLPGRDGGGSFAIYAYRSRVVVADSTLRTGDGGDGGDGQAGGLGGTGGTGGPGADFSQDPTANACAGFVGVGGDGGDGGDGGQGGTGGGGAGGPSVAAFAIGRGAAFTFAPGTRFQLGQEGQGGTGAGTGASGQSGETIAGQQSSATADLDGDDVPDAEDACPGVSGARTTGCPARPAKLADSDGDGLPDGQDGCPSVAGAAANGGCPPAPGPPPAPVDADGDGSPAGQDCNDANAAIHPGATEIRGNAVDENCDGVAQRLSADPAKVSVAFTAAGKRSVALRRLVVRRLPAASKLVLTCKGKRCPFRTRTVAGPQRGGTLDLRARLAKSLRTFGKGDAVTLRITAPGYRAKTAKLR